MAHAMAGAEMRLVRDGYLQLYSWDGSASNPSKVDFVASSKALTLEYRASEKLNCVDDRAHALQLVIYHLSDREELDRLSTDEGGMRALLEGGYFDKSVKHVRIFNVQPGAKGQLIIDRPDGGRFIAVVAGYAQPDREASLYVTEYGIGRWITKGEKEGSRSKFMFKPMPLTINVSLGDTEMAARNAGRMLGELYRTQDLLPAQVDELILDELGWDAGAPLTR